MERHHQRIALLFVVALGHEYRIRHLLVGCLEKVGSALRATGGVFPLGLGRCLLSRQQADRKNGRSQDKEQKAVPQVGIIFH